MGRDALKKIIQHVLDETYDNWDGYYLSSTNPNWEEQLVDRIADSYESTYTMVV